MVEPIRSTDAMPHVGDASQATDEQIEGWRVTTFVSRVDDRIIHSLISRLDASEARNAELESELAETKEYYTDTILERETLRNELAALRKKIGDVPTPGESDRECAHRLSCSLDQYREQGAGEWDEGAEIISTHVASRLAPVQAELDEAVGLLQSLFDYLDPRVIQHRACEGDHICHVCETRYFVTKGEVERHTSECAYDNTRAFLARHQRDKPEGGRG